MQYPEIDKEIRKINLRYKIIDDLCISFIITDNKEAREYIKKEILAIDTDTILEEEIVEYDFYINRNNGPRNGIKYYQELCKKNNLILATGFEKYAEYLKEIGRISNDEEFYTGVFNMPRDWFYLQNKVKIILLSNQAEYDMFISDAADDFTSYAGCKIDIDKILKENNKEAEEIDER